MRGRLHKQRRANTCGVACVRTVLDLQFGVKVAEQAVEAHGTDAHDPILKHGTSASQLRRMVKGVSRTHNTGPSWTFRFETIGEIEDLAREIACGRYPVVRVFEESESCNYHFVVVLAVEESRVQVWDPDPHSSYRPKWYEREMFERWWGGDGRMTWYGVVGGRNAVVGSTGTVAVASA